MNKSEIIDTKQIYRNEDKMPSRLIGKEVGKIIDRKNAFIEKDKERKFDESLSETSKDVVWSLKKKEAHQSLAEFKLGRREYERKFLGRDSGKKSFGMYIPKRG